MSDGLKNSNPFFFIFTSEINAPIFSPLGVSCLIISSITSVPLLISGTCLNGLSGLNILVSVPNKKVLNPSSDAGLSFLNAICLPRNLVNVNGFPFPSPTASNPLMSFIPDSNPAPPNSLTLVMPPISVVTVNALNVPKPATFCNGTPAFTPTTLTLAVSFPTITLNSLSKVVILFPGSISAITFPLAARISIIG